MRYHKSRYTILVRETPADKGKPVAAADSEDSAKRIKEEWVDRLMDDGASNPEELVYVTRSS